MSDNFRREARAAGQILWFLIKVYAGLFVVQQYIWLAWAAIEN